MEYILSLPDVHMITYVLGTKFWLIIFFRLLWTFWSFQIHCFYYAIYMACAKFSSKEKKTFSIVHSFSCFQNERYEFLIMTYIFRICLNLSWFKHFFKSMHSLTYLRFVYLFFFVPSTRIYQSDRIQRLNFKASC